VLTKGAGPPEKATSSLINQSSAAGQEVQRLIIDRAELLVLRHTLDSSVPTPQALSFPTTSSRITHAPTTILIPSLHPHKVEHHLKATMSSAASPLLRAARAIPPKYKPMLAVLLNLGLSTLLGYLASPWVSNDLASMKNLPNYTSLVSLRIIEVLGYWIGGWDGKLPSAHLHDALC
jgi:hypothetical protein